MLPLIGLLTLLPIPQPYPFHAHVARVRAGVYGDPGRVDIAAKLALYDLTLLRGPSVKCGRFTAYHPDEGSGMGGGDRSALGDKLLDEQRNGRTDIAACRTSERRRWENRKLWVENWGMVTIRDNGPRVRGFDLLQRRPSDVDSFGAQRRRYVILEER